MKSLGRHIVVELFGCDPEVLNDVALIEKAMVEAAREANATVINSTFHHFSPFGVSGVVVIQESHLAIHTWPEYEFAAVDIFTCGEEVDPWICYKRLAKDLRSQYGSAIEMGRGQKTLLPKTTKQYEVIPPTYPKEKITPTYFRNIWFTERDDVLALSLRHTGDVLFRQKSPYQKVEVYETFAYGKMLVLDGMIMTTEQDEFIYHEMMAHVPLFTHPNPEQVLIIGGGDGGVLREVVRHEHVKEAVLVEIDAVVIEASKQFLPQIASSFNHPRAKVLIEDGIQYVADAPSESYDVVMIDASDPIGPAEGLFTETFYRNIYRILKPNGILVAQTESPHYNRRTFQAIYECLTRIFGEDHTYCYLVYVPTYPSGTWTMCYCTKGTVHPLNDLNDEKADPFSQKHQLKYYTAAVHRAAFALPPYVSQLLRKSPVSS
jgi:spermidine synthase